MNKLALNRKLKGTNGRILYIIEKYYALQISRWMNPYEIGGIYLTWMHTKKLVDDQYQTLIQFFFSWLNNL